MPVVGAGNLTAWVFGDEVNFFKKTKNLDRTSLCAATAVIALTPTWVWSEC